MDEEQAVKAAALCAILGNPVRLSLIRAMLLQDTSVAGLSSIAGLSQSATSQHLARLRVAGLVETRRDAQTIYYRCTSEIVRELLGAVDEAVGMGPDNRNLSLERVPLFEPAAHPPKARRHAS